MHCSGHFNFSLYVLSGKDKLRSHRCIQVLTSTELQVVTVFCYCSKYLHKFLRASNGGDTSQCTLSVSPKPGLIPRAVSGRAPGMKSLPNHTSKHADNQVNHLCCILYCIYFFSYRLFFTFIRLCILIFVHQIYTE